MNEMDLFIGEGAHELFDPSFREQILLEIVGCMNLSESTAALPSDEKETMDPHCVVKIAGMTIHKTKPVYDTSHPIWTIRTGSLCLVEIPTERALDHTIDGSPRQKLRKVATPQSVSKTGLTIDIWDKGKRLGRICLSLDQIRDIVHEQAGERLEVDVTPAKGSHLVQKEKPAVLSLRMRHATTEDLIFLGKHPPPPEPKDGDSEDEYSDIELEEEDEDEDNANSHTPTTTTTNNDPLGLANALGWSRDLSSSSDHNKTTKPKKKKKKKDHTRRWSAEAADMEFHEVRSKSIFQKYKRVKENNDNDENDNDDDDHDKDGNETTTCTTVKTDATPDMEYRVMPFPDPNRPAEQTEWMTKEQILSEALKPSQHFVHAGTGTVGRCFVEILGCKDLPNLDAVSMQKDDRTDPFVAMVFEDCMVRTDMLWDELNPRWMPWTMRAFCFHIRHPQSLLLLGVFDYDDSPLENHDAIGRVVINMANFYADTTYLLHYNLQHDPRYTPEEEQRGRIMLRLRVEWHDEVEMHKLSYTTPPKCIINCKTEKTYQVLRYLKRGALDMEQASMDSIKVYASEIGSYWTRFCHFLDILFEVFLWRGRLKFGKNRSIWFPHHSMVLSAAVLLGIEYPRHAGPIFLYGISWVLLTINFHNARHPYPWKQVKKFWETNYAVFTGKAFYRQVEIDPVPASVMQKAEYYEKLGVWRGKRMSELIGATLSFYNKIYTIYSTNSVTSKMFSTKRGGWKFLESKLTYPHMALKYLCKYVRVYLAFINWDGYAANNVVLRCLALATMWLFLPVNSILLWATRIVAWTLLGPWMKLLDIYWVHSWYKTSDELVELIELGVREPDPDLPDFDYILQSGWLADLSYSGRLVSEHAAKLKDMRNHRFGRFSEFIPFLDDSRYRSIPLPSSTAEPYVKKENENMEIKHYVQCQKLTGSMIMECVEHQAVAEKKARESKVKADQNGSPRNGSVHNNNNNNSSPPRTPSPSRRQVSTGSLDQGPSTPIPKHYSNGTTEMQVGSPVRLTLKPSESMHAGLDSPGSSRSLNASNHGSLRGSTPSRGLPCSPDRQNAMMAQKRADQRSMRFSTFINVED